MPTDLRELLDTTLGHTFAIERELGGGAMSRVFLSTERALDRRVVLKVLPPDLAAGVSIERFKREIAVAAKLQHAHIVPLLSAGEAEGLPWFAMPYVDGESLRDRLGRGELPIAEAIRILRDVASALAYAHSRGVVHRDIKPENVLFAGGAAMVTDFGVAKALADAGRATSVTSTGVALGTPAYMAPEQISADPKTDHRADIYAFGVLAYELLTGRAPFSNRGVQGLFAAHMTETAEPVERIRTATPSALAQLVARCLAKSAADRPQDANEIVNALDAISTPVAGSTPLAAAGPRGVGRRAALIGAAAIVVAAIVLGSWLWQRSRSLGLSPRRVAVAPFTDLTGDTALSRVGLVAAHWLTDGIARTDSADVVNSTTVAAILEERTPSVPDVVQRLAAATRAGTVVTGTIAKRGADSIQISATIIDARSGKIIRSIDAVAGPRSNPLVAIDSLRERLLGSFATGDLVRRVALAAQPPRYAAYEQYLEGARVFIRDQRGSRVFFRRAIELDSSFVLGYIHLAITHSNVNEFDDAERIVAMADRLRDRLSPYDRLYLDWVHSVLNGDNDANMRAMRALMARDTVGWMPYVLGMHGVHSLHIAEALPAFRAADSGSVAIGWRAQALWFTRALHLAGNNRAALERIERGRREAPNSLVYLSAELSVLAGLNDTSRALALADTLLEGVGDGIGATQLAFVVTAANEFHAHGNEKTSRDLLSRALAWSRTHPNPSVAARAYEDGRLRVYTAQPDSAIQYFLTARRDTANPVGRMGWMGFAYARKGDRVAATAIVDSLRTLDRKWLFGVNNYWRAAILAEFGQRAEAVQLLRQAAAQGAQMWSWHADGTLASLHGYAPFEQLIAPKP